MLRLTALFFGRQMRRSKVRSYWMTAIYLVAILFATIGWLSLIAWTAKLLF
jgi:hypothetical protein